MNRVATALILLAALVLAAPSAAQPRFALELRGGANLAADTFAATDLEAGVGLEGSVSIGIAPLTSLYAGWDWQNRRAERAVFGTAIDVEDTGYAFGLRLAPPFTGPWLRAGVLANHVELETDEGDIVADSAHTWGWEAGGGLQASIGEAWMITPGVRYRRFEPDVRIGDLRTATVLSYVVIDVGFAFTF